MKYSSLAKQVRMHPPASPFKIQMQQGFSILESVVSMTIMLGALGGLVPLFLTFKVSTVDNKVATDATAITQRVMDQLRQADWEDYENLVGTRTTLPSNESLSNLKIDPSDPDSPNYDATITYCPLDAVPAGICDSGTAKFIRVEVFKNGEIVDEAETIYTNLAEDIE